MYLSVAWKRKAEAGRKGTKKVAALEGEPIFQVELKQTEPAWEIMRMWQPPFLLMTSAHVIGAGTLGFQLAESSWQAGYWRNILFAGWPWSGHRNTEGEVGMAAGEAQSSWGKPQKRRGASKTSITGVWQAFLVAFTSTGKTKEILQCWKKKALPSKEAGDSSW